MHGFLIFVALVLVCFWAPSLVSTGTSYAGLKRVALGAIVVGVALLVLEGLIALGGTGLPRFLDLVAFSFALWMGTALYWGPLLIVRVVQLGLKDRGRFGTRRATNER